MFVTTRKPSFRLRTVSLFSWTVEQNVQDTQMITCVTEGARRGEARQPLLGLPPSFLASTFAESDANERDRAIDFPQ